MAKMKEVIEEKGELWAIAAMIDGSIGYHTVNSARDHIQRYLAGEEKCWCERALATRGGSLVREVEHDLERFLWLEESNPKRVKRVLKYVEALLERSEIEQVQAGLMYPTTML